MSQRIFVKNFFAFFFFLLCHFEHFVKTTSSTLKSRIHDPNRPQFGKRIDGLKVTSFGVNMINIQGIISHFMLKAKSNFCHAYRVNRSEEQAENRYVARLNIREVPFGGYKLIE